MVVAANLTVGVIPQEVPWPSRALLGLESVPLENRWADRRFVICCRDFQALDPAAQRMVRHPAARAVQEGAGAGAPADPAAGARAAGSRYDISFP